MDPLTLSTTFSSVVGLLCNFKTERSSGDLNQFIAWLKEMHLGDVAAGIECNNALSMQLSMLMTTNHEDLISRLARMDEVISSIAAHIDGFSGVATAIHPGIQLSDQAVSIVRQLVEAKAHYFIEHRSDGLDDETELILIRGVKPGTIGYAEHLFIDDDLATLVEIGLLRLENTERGSRKFYVTREAVRFISAIG